MESLTDLLIEGLQQAHSAEQQSLSEEIETDQELNDLNNLLHSRIKLAAELFGKKDRAI